MKAPTSLSLVGGCPLHRLGGVKGVREVCLGDSKNQAYKWTSYSNSYFVLETLEKSIDRLFRFVVLHDEKNNSTQVDEIE